MPSPDTLTTVALTAVALLGALAVRFTEPGGLFRVPLIVRGVRYHRAGKGRHVRCDAPAPAAPVSVADDVCEGFPWAPPAALATIPDPAALVRTS